MNTALAVRPSTLPSDGEWRTMMQMATELVRSGMLPAHIKSPAAAVAVIQKGRELGIAPMYALSNIIVIQGKPTANAELMAALIYRDHGDDALDYEESTVERCTIAYKRRNASKRSKHTFTQADAKAAGLSGGNWAKYPAAMLRARCISAVARMGFPDSIGGMYTPEELGHSEDVEGEFVSVNGHPVVVATGEIVENPQVRQLNGSAKKKFSVTSWLDWFRESREDDEPAETKEIDDACIAWDRAVDKAGASSAVVFWATDSKGFKDLGKLATKRLLQTATRESFTDADRQQLMNVAATYAEQVTAGQDAEPF